MTKTFLRFVQCNASGNHLIIDIMSLTPYTRLSDYIEFFISAFIIHKNNPCLKYVAPESRLDTALGHLRSYSDRFKIPFSAECIDHTFLMEVFERFSERGDFMFFAHGGGLFTHSKSFETDKGYKKVWTSELAKQSSIVLRDIISKSGYTYNEISLIRHPVDILLSRIERYGLDNSNLDEHCAHIRETFDVIRCKSDEQLTPIIKYEDIVREKGECLKPYLKLTKKQLEKIDCEIYYSKTSINKHFKYSISKNKLLMKTLQLNIDWIGYSYATDKSLIDYYYLRIKQHMISLSSDIKLSLITSLFGYKKKGQSEHHSISLIAKVFRKLFNITRDLLNMPSRHRVNKNKSRDSYE